MKRAVALVVSGLTAIVVGIWWLAAVIAGLCLMMLVRDHGPDDPPNVTQLRRRQLNEFCKRQGADW